MPDFNWLATPSASDAPGNVVSDFTELAEEYQLGLATANFLGLQPERYFQMREDGIDIVQMLQEAGKGADELSKYITELRQPPEDDEQAKAAHVQFTANAEFDAGRQILRVRGVLDQGFRLWAIKAHASHLYRYHRREFETFDEMMQAVQEDLPEDSTTRSDAVFIAKELHPFALKHNIPEADRIWGDGTIEKARAAVPLLRGLLGPEGDVLPENVAQVRAIVKDVLSLTGERFKSKYKPTQQPETQLEVFDFTEGAGAGFLIIPYTSALQRLTLERRLPGTDWHHGTGHEKIITRISRMEAKAKARRQPQRKLTTPKKRKPAKRKTRG